MGGNAWLARHRLWGWAVGTLFVHAVLWGVHDDHPELFQGPVGRALFASAVPRPHHQPARKPATGTPKAVPQPGDAGGAIPARYLALYKAAARHECPGLHWSILAGVGKVESDHGRSSAPGVHSGLNRAGCCAGPMQFNLTDGPPSTWAQFGQGNVYDPRDAIPAAARKLCAQGAPGDLHGALLAYNRSEAYVAEVLAVADRYRRRRTAVNVFIEM
jgi:hypothetical protein